MKNSPFHILIISLFFYSTIAQNNLIKIEGFTQGTTYHISYYDKKNRNFKAEIEKILLDFDFSVSTYNPNSIISKINTNQTVDVDDYFITCFKKAKKIWKQTEGAFDPTVQPLVSYWGFWKNKREKIDSKKIDSILKFVDFKLIELKGHKIIKKDPRVSLDFNAFAQGYSVDVISNFLKKKKCKSFIVEIGGEVYAKGKKKNRDYWKIGIEEPIDNSTSNNPLKAIIKLKNMAIATSGNYRKYFEENGIKYAHHIDPKTGYPTKNNLLSATILSKKGITSDATATGILVMGLEKAKLFLAKNKKIKAYLIYSDEIGNFTIYKSSQINKWLEFEN
ncbi:FAD:protein FMN transferase [Flavobacterium sp. 20NA77.7]|uniref:FAD:protein FMN transferase n=1 Tax=Flavobacterium nakdongensis TaxID=3073563 RepID=A0ABY9R8Y6_9FLAO|nr:FAD:protein FMN transferase [Flavobacterium sp. 20NA77.7]WMW77224.1 FAD:protein FMN transferase [Flavobacterium sp. 20NA77.7]